jgi:AcrR family transcriptional regulator
MSTNARPPLTRDKVLATAVELADHIGADALTMRKLADALDIKPMSLYHHVANKEAILDGMVDVVFAEIDPPPPGLPWRDAMAHRCRSARQVLRRHPWATPLMESRTSPGEPTLRHHDAVLACLIGADLPMPLVAHAYAVLDAFVYGFAIQEASLPFEGEELADLADELIASMAEHFPNLAAFTAQHVLQPGYDFGDSFEFGLAVIIDGLEATAAHT